MSMHRTNMMDCEVCDSIFKNKSELEEHVVKAHGDEWNCNDCPFQTNEPSLLIKHLKETFHQPSSDLGNKKKKLNDFKRCYTCNLEVDGYVSLMNHRQETHPSNKKCNKFPEGRCTRGNKCWYVHAEDLMELEESFEEQKHTCYNCDKTFKTKDEMRKHKKSAHTTLVQVCEKFNKNECPRSEENCWYKHELSPTNTGQLTDQDKNENQVFQGRPQNPPPPDQLKMILKFMKDMSMKIEKIEEKFETILS